MSTIKLNKTLGIITRLLLHNNLTNLDKCENIIKVIANMLLNNSNQDSQLLEKELSEIDISCSNHIEETWHHMGNVWNTLYA